MNIEDIKNASDKKEAIATLKKQYKAKCEELISQGVIIIDSDITYIEDTVKVEPNTVIYPLTELKGETVIKGNCEIGPSSTIIDSRIDENSKVVKSHVIKSQIGKNADIGPYTHLREKTILHDNTKVGSYSETKNITLGDGSKIPHLSYAGDAVIGKNTNIGAGSIFANYDGIKKSHTTVGDNVKIGSNTILVAPVNVGNWVYTGADTVVRKDIKDDTLCYSENTQYFVEDWVKKNRAEQKKQAEEK